MADLHLQKGRPIFCLHRAQGLQPEHLERKWNVSRATSSRSSSSSSSERRFQPADHLHLERGRVDSDALPFKHALSDPPNSCRQDGRIERHIEGFSLQKFRASTTPRRERVALWSASQAWISRSVGADKRTHPPPDETVGRTTRRWRLSYLRTQPPCWRRASPAAHRRRCSRPRATPHYIWASIGTIESHVLTCSTAICIHLGTTSTVLRHVAGFDGGS